MLHIKQLFKSVNKAVCKKVDLYSAFIVVPHTQSTRVQITHFKLHCTCLYLVSIHQMAHPQTEVADI